jgi:hypothetical protein
MTKLAKALNAFQKLLDVMWEDVQELDSTVTHGSYALDWIQGNWENIVESAITYQSEYGGEQVFLVVYGEGADFYAGSSRILEPSASATHAVCCRPKTGEVLYNAVTRERIECPPEGLPVDRFVSFANGWYFHAPPFDHLLLQPASADVVVDLTTVEFSLNTA